MLLTLTSDEIEVIVRTIGVPLGAFGLDELVEKSGETKEACAHLIETFEKYRDQSSESNIEMDKENLKKLSKIFDISAEIVDPIEMSIIVGYSWHEAMALSKKLHNLIEKGKEV